MTVTDNYVPDRYTGNGAVSAYDWTFPIKLAADLQIIETDTDGVDTTLTYPGNYTVVINGDGTGTATRLAGVLPTNYKWRMLRASALDQQTDFTARSTVPPSTLQTAVDRLALQVQQLQEQIDRTPKLKASEAGEDFTLEIPKLADRASKTYGWNASGEPVALTSLDGAVPTTAFTESLLDDADASEAQTTLGISTFAKTIIDDTSAKEARSTLGVTTISVDTIAAMTALTTTDLVGGIIVRGYTTAGDGGGGEFYWDGASAATANAGTIFASDAGGTGRFIRIYSGAVDPKWFAAVADGASDDTSVINSIISSGLLIIDGGMRSYVVTTIVMASNCTLKNFKLKEKADASAVSLKPVVKIGNDVDAISNVILQNIIIDGNRQNLANVNMGAGEDGGMHGIRIGAGATDVRILDCQANYCGTAGLAIHNEIPVVGTATYPIKRIYVENFVAEYNREHGMFVDSVDGLYVNGAVLNNNGQTLTGSLPDTDGRTGAKAAGALFGAGFDIETYVGYASSYVKNVNFNNVVAKGNSQGCLLYIPSVVDAVADIPCQNIHLSNCDFDKSTLGVNFYGLKLFANSAVGAKYGIDGVTISGRMNGHVDANNTKGVTYASGWIESDSTIAYKAVINNSDDFTVTCPSNRNNILVETLSALGVVKDNGAGTWSPTVSTTVLADGVHKLQIDANISGGTIAGGNMAWTLTMPTGVVITSASVNGYNTTSWKTTPTHVAYLTASTLQVFVTPTDDTVTVQLRVGVTF